MLLGGAALTRTYVERDLREVYEGRLFYGKDAFEGLHTMDTLMEGKRTGTLDPDFGRALGGRDLPPRKSEQRAEPTIAARHDALRRRRPTCRSSRRRSSASRVAKGISLDEIAGYINETALFRNQWQFRPDKTLGETDAEFKERIRPTLRAELDNAKAEGWLVPAVVWGYFPVNSEGNDLVVWTDDDRRTERLRFTFPRQRKRPPPLHRRLLPLRRERRRRLRRVPRRHRRRRAPSQRERELFAADRYQEYLLCHGLSVEMTEALAELWHRRIREEWGFADEDGPTLAGLFRQQYRGSRYSWGYPACPDLEDQAKLDELLELAPHRREAHRGVPARARAEHLGDHRPPPRGQVLHRLTSLAWRRHWARCRDGGPSAGATSCRRRRRGARVGRPPGR